PKKAMCEDLGADCLAGPLLAGDERSTVPSPVIIASARSSIEDDGAQMPSGALQEKLPFTLLPNVAHPPSRDRAAIAQPRSDRAC
ncbi:hypothetical protein, partial [Klebsiella pneumoniae]|uniref:hypothetical protein n=1 Tax=Klebsiella pneumoniae TaxID=573 RepID=UPI001954C29F